MTRAVTTPRRAAKERTCILVLGMHRSGTSALAGVLSLLGCDEPRTPMVSSRGNEKGHFESLKVYALHKELLQSAGTSWDDWVEFYSGWFDSNKADEFQDRALTLLGEEFGTSRLFVLKDPRICRLIPFWLNTLEQFGATPRFVLTHRNPLEVARSLNARNDFDTSFGLLLWLRHVLDAEVSTRGLTRYFTSYNALMGNWADVVRGMQKTLGVTFPRMTDKVVSDIDDFLTGSLRHFDEKTDMVADNPRLSRWVRTTFAVMEKWSAQGEDRADYAILDKLRDEFNDAAPAFSRLVKDGQSVKKQIADSTAALTEEANRRADAEKSLKEVCDDLTKTDAALAKSALESEAAAKALADEQHHRAEIAATLREVRDAEAQTRSALAQRSLEAEEVNRELQSFRAVAAAAQADHAQQVQSLEHRVEAQGAELADQIRNAQHLARQLDTRFKELGELTKLLVRAESKSADLADLDRKSKERTQQLERTARDAERKYQAILLSTSWRMTAPLRRLSMVLRRR